MNAATYVDKAARLAATLEKRESAMASIDAPTARARIARRFGIPASVLHSLKYRPPKSISIDIFQKLIAAVEHQAAEQIKACEHDMATARACSSGAHEGALCALEDTLASARWHLSAVRTGEYPHFSVWEK